MTDRPGLYIIALITMLASCNSCDKITNVSDKISDLEKQVSVITTQQGAPQIYRKQVVGDATEDLFWVIGKDTVFVEIDGKNVKDYLKPQEEPRYIIK